jgi:DNA-binding HxlR family transcriptional regulator
MSDTEQSNSYELLVDVASRLERIESRLERESELRVDVDANETAKKILIALRENGRLTSNEVKSKTGMGDATRPLAKLYHAYYVDRSECQDQKHVRYEYEISDKGRRALDVSDEQIQSEISEVAEPVADASEPWHGTELNRSQWYALKVVAEHGDHPKPDDVNGEYRKLSGANEQQRSCAISARLSELYTDDFLDRIENPHRYWLTEKGRQFYDEHKD